MTSKPFSRLLPSRNDPSHLYAEVSVLLPVRSRFCTPWLVQPLPASLLLARNCTCITLRYTRAAWMWPAMTGHRLVTLKFIVIPYLLTCRSFPHVYIQFLLHFGLGHPPHEVTITTSASSPHILHILHPSQISFSIYPSIGHSV
jgi:hypothetical protein